MDNRPIGIFDSGVGGLTAVPHIMRELPSERFIYFGDTARTPYGSKAKSTIKNFTMQIADFLVHKNVKMLVIACNTITSTCLEDLQAYYPNLPIVGIIEPAAKKISMTCSARHRIGIIGTKATIHQRAYINAITRYNPQLRIYESPCPIFVPLIEEGIIDNPIMELSVKYYLDEFVDNYQLDTLVLGCTHYPLIRQIIERLYPQLKIVDPSFEIVESVKETLMKHNILAHQSAYQNIFYASDLSENFMNMISSIFGKENVNVDFKNFDLDGMDCK
ncbi:MAG: glutamate racemase [Bacillota bacterium]